MVSHSAAAVDFAEVSSARVAAVAAFGAVVVWGVKALVIWNAGGLDESRLESPLFGLGLVLIVLAYAALGLAVTAGRDPWLRVTGLIAGIVIGTALLLLIEEIVSSLVPDSAGWVQEEAGLWVGSVLTAGLALWCLASNGQPAREARRRRLSAP
jgi:hypothetical protein